jgi:hypothetical protein
MEERPDLEAIRRRNSHRPHSDQADKDVALLLAWIECLEMQLRVAAELRLMIAIHYGGIEQWKG